LNDDVVTEIVHEFYNIGTSKKMTIECRDNCPFCSASIEFSNHEMKVMARQFKPLEYKIFKVKHDGDTKVMRLPLKLSGGLRKGYVYNIIKLDKKYDIRMCGDGISEGFDDDNIIILDDYIHRDNNQSIKDQYTFILNSFRN